MAPDGKSLAPRRFQTQAPTGPTRGITVHVGDPLKSIFVYVDETNDVATAELQSKQPGTVTFVSVGGKKVSGFLMRNWFPAGTWELTIGAKIQGKPLLNMQSIKRLFPEGEDQGVTDALTARGKNQPLFLASCTKEDTIAIDRLFASSQDRKVRLIVSYTKAVAGNAKTLPDTFPLTDANTNLLQDEPVAKLYLQFVQHFGHVDVDFSLARGGLTDAKVRQVEKNRPEIIAITNLFTQGFSEFTRSKGSAPAPAPTLDNFRGMEETIFYQKNAKNDLAARGLLAIGVGHLFFTQKDGTKATRPDIGVMRRTGGASGVLLYDRDGAVVRGGMGYLDTEFRSVDMTKVARDMGIPAFDINVSDAALYALCRSLSQTIGEPTVELEALVVSLYKYSLFIKHEIVARYSQELADRIIKAGEAFIAFFVAHAIASYLARSGNVAAVAFLALVKAAGMILGVDAVLLDMEKAAEAGRHFAQMEELHRGDPNEKPVLTELSLAHLHAGTAVLIDVIADFVMLVGVVLVGVGVKQGLKLGRAIREARARVPDANARMEVEVDADGNATSIKTKQPAGEIKVPVPKDPASHGLQTPELNPDAPPPQAPQPIDEPNANRTDGKQVGRRPDETVFVLKRPRALDMSPADFAKDTAAQAELFEAAKKAQAWQQALIDDVIKTTGVKTSSKPTSILKRDSLAEFTKVILKKAQGRKAYATMAEVTDMVRGRVDCEDPGDIERVALELSRRPGHGKAQWQRPGYPRFHLEVSDPETEIKNEWQIGTEDMTHLFEKPGIDTGKLNPDQFKPNLHDIEYNIFKAMETPSARDPNKAALQGLAMKVHIPEFCAKVGALADKLGTARMDPATLDAQIDALQKEAGAILRAIVSEKGGDPAGTEFLQQFAH